MIVYLNSSLVHGAHCQRRVVAGDREEYHGRARPPEETSPRPEPTMLPASATPHRDHPPHLIAYHGSVGLPLLLPRLDIDLQHVSPH